MFRFEHGEWIFMLAAPVVVLALYLAYHMIRKRAWKQLASEAIRSKLMAGYSKWKERVKWTLMTVAFLFLTVALVNPQWGYKKEKVQKKSADIYVALDISNSMLARDIPPSRLDRAKRFTTNLFESLKSERIGLILFAGSAYLQMPLTTDYAAAQMFVRSANPGLAGTQGTAIGEVMDLALRAYDENTGGHRAVIIITDGESHDENAREMIEKGRENGIVTFFVGVGTQEGDFIPINIRGREDYKRDDQGNPVRTMLNEQLMRDLARLGDGEYFDIYDGDQVIQALEDRINELEKKDIEQRSFTEFESYFQYFLLPGILLLVLEMVLSRRKEGIRRILRKLRRR